MRISIITLFPDFFTSPLQSSLLGKALANGVLEVECVNLRDYAVNAYGKVDDNPYGGGEGMVLMVEPIDKALGHIRTKTDTHVILLSPRGPRFCQQDARRLAVKPHLTLVCGHYEGVDERVAEHLCDESFSLGDFVLSGGEPAALALVDSLARLQPGFLGNPGSLADESFEQEQYIEYPQYTRPAVYRDWKVPEVLLQGDHRKIAEWRQEQARLAWQRFRGSDSDK